MTEHTILFEKEGYICEATVSYTTPQGKWSADSDLDYQGGYEVLDMVVYQDDYVVDKHPITWEDVVRHYEIVVETNTLELQLSSCESSCDDEFDNWID